MTLLRNLGSSILTRFDDAAAQRGVRSPIADIDGSFVISRDGRITVWFGVQPDTAFDQLTISRKDKIFGRHLSLIEALEGCEVHLEVLSLPVTKEERTRRIRQYDGVSEVLRRDRGWEQSRSTVVENITDYLQEVGDYETRCYLGVTIKPCSTAPSKAELEKLNEADRFYIEQSIHGNLIEPARALINVLRPAWGDNVWPLTKSELGRLVLELNWPGQSELMPLMRQNQALPDRRLELEYYGQANVDASSPQHLQIDYYGRKSYVSYLPMAGIPILQEYLPEEGSEYGFTADTEGRRIRFSWRFRVVPGSELLQSTKRKKNDIESHTANLVKAGGEEYDLATSRMIAETFYRYLRDEGLVVVGTPMLVLTASDTESLDVLRADVIQRYRRNGITLIADQHLQKRLWQHSRVGSDRHSRRYVLMLDTKAAAQSMPFVTSAPRRDGPDFLGFVYGRERAALFGGLDAQLQDGIGKAPVWSFTGNSGGGKTTTVLDQMIALVQRRQCIGIVNDLAKGDTALLDGSSIPGVPISHIDLRDFKGGLNLAALAPNKSARLDMIVEFFVNAIGTDWDKRWRVNLASACQYVLNRADEQGKLPDLRDVVSRLSSRAGGGEHDSAIAAELYEAANDETFAPVFFDPNPSVMLLDVLSKPGLHILQFSGLPIPDASTPENKYTGLQKLAMAGLDVATILGLSLANRRDLMVAIAQIEFHKTAKSTKGWTVANYLARVGRALNTITAYDTQMHDDMDESLLRQITGAYAFSPEFYDQAAKVLRQMNQEVTDHRVEELLTMAEDVGHTGSNRGTALVRLPTRELVVAQGVRWYVGKYFVTNQSELAELSLVVSGRK